MRGDTITGTARLVVEECCNCGVLFAIPEDLQARLRNNHRSFWCPNGHGQSYTGKTEAQKLREELDRERDRAARFAAQRDQAEAEAERIEDRRRAQKAATTRARKRHAAGVCPACHRSFPNVKAHMDTKHPDFDPEKGAHEGS